ncbi:hypothetical protein [Salininema proteolyticum]|uniref:DUF2383 domain-containing protein n=1 Tax=Salininema proteolyticum TaxID=1607685 RepID=A0ABV8TV97_9ACTN
MTDQDHGVTNRSGVSGAAGSVGSVINRELGADLDAMARYVEQMRGEIGDYLQNAHSFRDGRVDQKVTDMRGRFMDYGEPIDARNPPTGAFPAAAALNKAIFERVFAQDAKRMNDLMRSLETLAEQVDAARERYEDGDDNAAAIIQQLDSAFDEVDKIVSDLKRR